MSVVSGTLACMDDTETPSAHTGRVQFWTITGSFYDLDFDAGACRRTTGTPSAPDRPSAELRSDDEVVELLAFTGELEVGQEVVLHLQLPNVTPSTLRLPTPIVRVEWITPPREQATTTTVAPGAGQWRRNRKTAAGTALRAPWVRPPPSGECPQDRQMPQQLPTQA